MMDFIWLLIGMACGVAIQAARPSVGRWRESRELLEAKRDHLRWLRESWAFYQEVAADQHRRFGAISQMVSDRAAEHAEWISELEAEIEELAP